ncbi:MAG: Hpt domain-containing protein [Caldilineales bacterium]|nr:Hpt domain-containing protein [Caldilineales bacterium]
MSNATIIDEATLDALAEMADAEFVGELIDAFCEETPRQITELRAALADGDVEVFRRTAHTIKSTSATLGAPDFAKQAKALEDIGRAGDLSDAGDQVDRLAESYPQIEQALRAWQHGQS